MAFKLKKLCKIKEKAVIKHRKEILEVIQNPEFLCTKCGRASSQKKFLCSPMKINW